MRILVVVTVWLCLAWTFANMAALGLQSFLLTSVLSPEVETLEAAAHAGPGPIFHDRSVVTER